MADQLQLRGGTTAEHATFTGALREVTVDTDKDTVVVHDNATAGGHPLAKENLSNVSAATAATKLDGQTVKFGLGAAATPSVTFNGDLNTGVYSPGADQVAISTNGTGRLFVDASGNVTVNGGGQITSRNVGASPGLGRVQLGESGAWTVEGLDTGYGGSGAYLKVSSGASERLRITSAGLVGVGTSSPGSNLDLAGTTSRIRWDVNNAYTLATHGNAAFSAFAPSVQSAADFQYQIAGIEKMRLDSSGRVGIGSSSPDVLITAKQTNAGATGATLRLVNASTTVNSATKLAFTNTTSETADSAAITAVRTASGQYMTFGIEGTEAVRIDESRRVGIGTTSPGTYGQFAVRGAAATGSYGNVSGHFSDASTGSFFIGHASNTLKLFTDTSNLTFGFTNSEAARIDSSGRLLVGTSSTSGVHKLVVQARTDSTTGNGGIVLARGSTPSGADQGIGIVAFENNNSNTGAYVYAESDGAWTAGTSHPTRLGFWTCASGANNPTERMRIDKDGSVLFNGTSTDPAGANINGCAIGVANGNYISITRSSSTVAAFNRKTDDGTIFDFKQDGVTEGTISVSGTTVSYNGAHLSRWSQLPSGAERTEILRGTVLSNIDEMCEWGDEDNEQLNRMKVSDVEGDKNVSGVFQAWDDDDDTYTNDFYCAMTGDFIIRIAEGVTVERGDLLMSAGDGTAKPQDDDIIRSKTIAKVTSTNVSCTYDDGSYCVPCVLMAC